MTATPPFAASSRSATTSRGIAGNANLSVAT
jgi:hypothetical protein